MLPVRNRAAVIAQRALHRVILLFCVLVRFVHVLSLRNGSLYSLFFRLVLSLIFHRVVIHFKDKRSPVPAALAEIHLADISPGNREDISALADRTAQHGRDSFKQLYMSILHKN
jgi:hypothetical protein